MARLCAKLGSLHADLTPPKLYILHFFMHECASLLSTWEGSLYAQSVFIYIFVFPGYILRYCLKYHIHNTHFFVGYLLPYLPFKSRIRNFKCLWSFYLQASVLAVIIARVKDQRQRDQKALEIPQSRWHFCLFYSSNRIRKTQKEHLNIVCENLNSQ